VIDHAAQVERTRIPATPDGLMRLHRLERPEPWPADLVAKMRDCPPENFYPDYAPFYARLADHTGFPADRIVVGQGIEGMIRDLVMLCCRPGDGLAFTWPTCAMFDLYARIFQTVPVRIVTDPDRPLGVADVIAAVKPGTKLLLLPNPGQPVDLWFDLDELADIADHCGQVGAVLAIDEAYHGFGAPTALPLVRRFQNVVVLRTFSKMFGAAAIRVGFAVAGWQLSRALHGVRQSGEIAGPSLHAATVLLDNLETVEGHAWLTVEGRDWLRDEMRDRGYTTRGHWANHVLIDAGSPARATGLAAALQRHGVMVRHSMPPPLDRHLMVTAARVGLMASFVGRFDLAVQAEAA
jgi:histidinol-phosphate/aromatic aminotransferase/cobyric acid decarboxylase-like protein